MTQHAQYWDTESRAQPTWRALAHLVSFIIRVVETGAQLGRGDDMKLTEHEVEAFRKTCDSKVTTEHVVANERQRGRHCPSTPSLTESEAATRVQAVVRGSRARAAVRGPGT